MISIFIAKRWISGFSCVKTVSILSCKRFVTPATAETTRLVASFSERDSTIDAELSILFALAIEVPPNFKLTINILKYNL